MLPAVEPLFKHLPPLSVRRFICSKRFHRGCLRAPCGSQPLGEDSEPEDHTNSKATRGGRRGDPEAVLHAKASGAGPTGSYPVFGTLQTREAASTRSVLNRRSPRGSKHARVAG